MTRKLVLAVALALLLAAPAAASAVPTDPALAQERYYSSYGEPVPAATPAPAAPSDDAPWKALAIGSGALVLALIGAELVTLTRLRRATAA